MIVEERVGIGGRTAQLNSEASPLRDGELTPCVIEKEIPLHGEGEQSTKVGEPCPNWLHPPERCRFENEGSAGALLAPVFPPLEPEVGPDDEPEESFDTAICKDFCCDCPLESETETVKLKFPEAVGVPENVPELLASCTPVGN